jgi:hypothetical protein
MSERFTAEQIVQRANEIDADCVACANDREQWRKEGITALEDMCDVCHKSKHDAAMLRQVAAFEARIAELEQQLEAPITDRLLLNAYGRRCYDAV